MMKSIAVSRALREAAARQRQQQSSPTSAMQARLDGRSPSATVALPVPSMPWLGR